MNITLRQLRAFIAVSDTGSFTEAARQLHLTQSALSVLVRELESELGVRMFDRHTRSVVPTEVGRDLYPHARRVLGDLAEAEASVSALRDKKRGQLRVAAPQLMACTLMPQVIAVFTARYPDVQVTLVDTLPEQLLGLVQSSQVALAVGPDAGPATDVARRTVQRDVQRLVCRPDHPLAKRRKVRWDELQTQAFIAPTRDFMKRLLPQLLALPQPVALRPTYELSYITTALGMVAAGLGITACPSYAAPLIAAHGLKSVPLVEPVFHREVCVYQRAGASLSPAAEAFMDCLIGVTSSGNQHLQLKPAL